MGNVHLTPEERTQIELMRIQAEKRNLSSEAEKYEENLKRLEQQEHAAKSKLKALATKGQPRELTEEETAKLEELTERARTLSESIDAKVSEIIDQVAELKDVIRQGQAITQGSKTRFIFDSWKPSTLLNSDIPARLAKGWNRIIGL